MEKIPVSVVIIAKDEEKNIRRCLDSVKWADEVIVVDGFSSDGTVDIARALGARIVQHKFTGSFADERNAGLDKAHNAWTLHLDADEIVTETFRNRLSQALTRREDVVLYKFKRRNFFLGHSMDHGGFNHYIPNLVNKNFVRFAGSVHERPLYTGKEGIIEAEIEHRPFDSISQFIERQNRYTSLLAQELFTKDGVLSNSEIKKGLVNKTFKTFWKSYIRKKGYKEGFYGFIFAILFSLINFLKWAKYWEICEAERKRKG